MPPLPPSYLDTVAIFATPDDEYLGYSATGFFCRHRSGFDNAFDGLFLVTSARAVDGNLANVSLLCWPRRGERPKRYRAPGAGGLALGTWVVAPELDLAVLHLDRERLAADAVRYRGFDADFRTLTTRDMKKRGIGEGDDVRILGFTPLGPSIPLRAMVRRGIIARVQDCYRRTSETFLLDATIVDGNRGSPVIMRLERGVDGRPLAQPTIQLVGVVSGYLPSRGTPLQVGDDGKTLLVQPHTGLVRVVPVNGLLELLETAAKRAGA